MPQITVKHNENFESALRRFKKTCDRAKVIQEFKENRYYQKPSEVRKLKKLEAIKNNKKELPTK
jgi:small subunit ribosomal protein S21